MNHQLSSIPSGANIVDDPQGPIWTQKTVKFGGGKIMVWGYIQYGGAREICKVDGNIDSAKYQQILASQYIPNYKRGQIFQQDGAPCHRFHYEVSKGGEDQGHSGMASTISRYEYY